MDLTRSRWAVPRPPVHSRIRSRAEVVAEEKAKAERLLGRLEWKAGSLLASYDRATAIANLKTSSSNGLIDASKPRHLNLSLGISTHSPETMFKLDFFEFYTLLERFITLCLSVLGVYVPASVPQNVNALRHASVGGTPTSIPISASTSNSPANRPVYIKSSHQFHANLLAILDEESCPLHNSLGNRDVRFELGRAKDYRNRWKDADEQTSQNLLRKDDLQNGHKETKLEDLNLLGMVETILRGLKDALDIVKGHKTQDMRNGGTALQADHEDMMMDVDIPYEVVDDAMEMDWE